MNIKPPGPPFSDITPQGVPDNGTPSTDRFASRARIGSSEIAQSGAEQAASASILAKYTKADLANPATMNTMVRDVLNGVFQTELSPMAKLPDGDRRAVVDFMANDPMCRRQVENYLQQILK